MTNQRQELERIIRGLQAALDFAKWLSEQPDQTQEMSGRDLRRLIENAMEPAS